MRHKWRQLALPCRRRNGTVLFDPGSTKCRTVLCTDQFLCTDQNVDLSNSVQDIWL